MKSVFVLELLEIHDVLFINFQNSDLTNQNSCKINIRAHINQTFLKHYTQGLFNGFTMVMKMSSPI